MAEDIKESIITKLVGSIPALIIVLGVALLVLGLAGGITYSNWLLIPQTLPRIVSGLAGAILVGLGIQMSVAKRTTAGIPDAAEFGITVTEPRDGDHVAGVDVRGTIAKAPPDGYELRVLRIYPKTDGFVFLRKARIDLRNHVWEALSCDIGGLSGERPEIGVFLVGPGGQSLHEYFEDAVSVYNPIGEELSN